MKAIRGYHLIKQEDLFSRPSNLMQISNADYLERTEVAEITNSGRRILTDGRHHTTRISHRVVHRRSRPEARAGLRCEGMISRTTRSRAGDQRRNSDSKRTQTKGNGVREVGIRNLHEEVISGEHRLPVLPACWFWLLAETIFVQLPTSSRAATAWAKQLSLRNFSRASP